MEGGTEVIKRTSLRKTVDTAKLKSFKVANDVVGYNIVKQGEYFSFLNRHSGNYTVDMNPIITFTEPFSKYKVVNDDETHDEKIEASIYKKLNGCKTQFSVGEISDKSYVKEWGVIKNYFLHKVNEIDTSSVIRLSEGEAILPRYRLADEIAIDKIDRNVFKSRWENDYYIRSLSGGKSKKVPGTKNIIEEKNFMSSSIVKPVKNYELFNFTIEQVETIEDLNEIKEAGGSGSQINYIETASEIIIDFYTEDALIKKIDSLGFRDTILKYVTAENSFGRTDTIEDDIYEYISNNMINLYSIDSISIYSIEFKKGKTEIIEALSLSDVVSGGYNLDNNFTYKIDPLNPLNFRLIYNKRIGFSYQIKPLVKIKY